MGASGWAYFVPYQSNINKALQELRQQVFEEGQYHNALAELQSMPPELRAQYLDEDEIEYLDTIAELNTLEELVEASGESGTHSIIDIVEISATPRFGAAVALSEQEAEEIFGTSQPNRGQIEEHESKLMSLHERGIATYVIVYKAGIPDEIYFTGFSGD